MDELFDTLACVSGTMHNWQAQGRNLIGTIAASLAVRALPGAEELRIDGRKTVCPDFAFRGYEGEIKACSENHKRSVLYKFRMEKEAAYCDPARYLYVFVSHSAKSNVKDRSEVVRALVQNGLSLYCATLAEVMALVQGSKLRSVMVPENANRRVGYYRQGYSDGFYLAPFRDIGYPILPRHRNINIAGTQVECRAYISEGWNKLIHD